MEWTSLTQEQAYQIAAYLAALCTCFFGGYVWGATKRLIEGAKDFV